MTNADAAPAGAVLLVDDEALVRMLGADILEEAGFTVVEAANADHALACLEAETIVQVLVTDIHMPGLPWRIACVSAGPRSASWSSQDGPRGTWAHFRPTQPSSPSPSPDPISSERSAV